jgi:hypothetical protein
MDIDSARTQPLTILLVNFHSACNTGDAALLESAISQLRSAFVEPRIVVSANYPDEPYLHSLGIHVLPSFGFLIGLNKKTAWKQVSHAILGSLICGLAAFFPGAWNRSARHFSQGWRMFIDSYHRADLVVNCPGNQFFTMGTFSCLSI